LFDKTYVFGQKESAFRKPDKFALLF